MTYKTGDKVKLEGTVTETMSGGHLLVAFGGDSAVVHESRVIEESKLTEDEASDYRAGDFEPALEPTAKVALLSVAENVEIKRAFETPKPTGEIFTSVEQLAAAHGIDLLADEPAVGIPTLSADVINGLTVTDAIGVPFSAVADEAEKEPVAEKPKRGRKKAE